MLYRETPPSARFGETVKCFWSLENTQAAGDEPEPVVPDGCIEIIFNLSDRFRRYHAGGEIETQPASIVAGQMDHSLLIGPSGTVRLFAIRFKPAGAYPFFALDLNEIFNKIVSLDDIWRRSTEIEERLAEAATFEAQVDVAEAALAERMDEKKSVDSHLGYAVRAISSGNGTKPIRLLAREIGISERGLERRFKRYIGVAPKTFSRITRFQRVLKTLESDRSILDAALAFGYFDQSHLINDFRQFTGTGPTTFLERSHRMTEMFLASG